jgi:hypothetical protein
MVAIGGIGVAIGGAIVGIISFWANIKQYLGKNAWMTSILILIKSSICFFLF